MCGLIKEVEGRAKASTELPSTIYELTKPFEWPSIETIRRSQKKHAAGSRDEGLKRNAVGLLVDKNDKIIIPDDNELKSRLAIIAHCGLAGHRGATATLKNLSDVFAFKGMQAFVRRFVQRCPQCVKNASGKLKTRPWGKQIVAQKPGTVLVADYLYIFKRKVVRETSTYLSSRIA